MNPILNGGAIVLLAAAAFLSLAGSAVRSWRLVLNGACVLAAIVVGSSIGWSMSHANIGAAAAVIMLLTLVGATFTEGVRGQVKARAVATLLSAAACLQLVDSPSPMRSILACSLGLVAICVGSSANQRASAKVFLLQSGCAFLLLIAGFVIAADDKSWLGAACLLVGLFMAGGIPPFQAGVLDLYEQGDSSQVFPYTVVPLHWFLALQVIELLPEGALSGMRFVLLGAVVVGSVAAISCKGIDFLRLSRVVLLSWAILFLTVSEHSTSECLLSFVAYLTATAGLHAVSRIVEARVGSEILAFAGMGRRLPQLAGFGLFFALAVAGLPFTANSFGSEAVGARAAQFGVGFVFAGYIPIALLGVAAYRHYTLTFLGPGTDAVPSGLDLKVRERLGLATIAAVSVVTTVLTLCKFSN